MRAKKALAALLAAVMLSALAAAPVQARMFPDITDPEVARAADTLSILGIVGGDENGLFNPADTLTRAQFCRMAIELLGRGQEAAGQMNRTIFMDVPGSHWARGYVNLAVNIVVDEGSGARLMMGTGGGKFEPGRAISYQEMVTTLLRVLGYGTEANASWPSGAIQTAARLELDKDLGVTQPAAPIARGQAAILFTRVLAAKPKGGTEPYAAALGTLVEKAIVLSTSGTYNGQSGWVITTAGGPYRPASQADPGLIGRRGTVLLDREGRFVTLLPDGSTSVTAVVSRAQGSTLDTSDGIRYTFSDSTPVYYGAYGGTSTWREQLPSILPGDTVTIYLEDGAVIGMFRAAVSLSSGFVVVRGEASASGFTSITGGAYDYTIRKNGSTISMSEIKPYDVATYDPIGRVLTICDTRLSCVYEDASPSPAAPSVIYAAGWNRFPVMDDAVDELAGFKIGDAVTLLFTADGQVAGAVKARTARGNAVGVVRDGSVRLLGTNVTLKADDTGWLEGQLVAASGDRGELVLDQLRLDRASGSFDRDGMTLGRLPVSDSVQIYEEGAAGLVPVALSALPATVAAGRVRGCHTDTSGRVDLIVLRNVTGDSETYGRIEPFVRYELMPVAGRGAPQPVYEAVLTGWIDSLGRTVDEDGWLLDEDGQKIMAPAEIQQLKFITPAGAQIYDTYDGDTVRACFGSIRLYTVTEDGTERTCAAVATRLTAISNVRSADFYVEDGVTWVVAGRETYRVADDVLCYNKAASTGKWVWDRVGETQVYHSVPVWFDSLLDARVYAAALTIYVDGTGGRVRAVSAG